VYKRVALKSNPPTYNLFVLVKQKRVAQSWKLNINSGEYGNRAN